MDIQAIWNLIQGHWVEITVVYLALLKILTTVRDAIDKTPQTDDNWFERIVTILQKVGTQLITGKRAEPPAEPPK